MGWVLRVAGWEKILAAEIQSARKLCFQWGVNDCATWALSVRSRILGRPELMPDWVGTYSSQLGAARVMRQRGWKNIADLASFYMGESFGVAFQAKRGDIVAAEGALGVCCGGTSFFLGSTGITARPTSACSHAWRV